ncbi:hypothetical protein [Streptomyces rhizosphaericus]|uniref:hypothetical protein n=1 Tax=Streptomyces rhizosphaericus TaxID=114699 RepID=UPI001B33464E|nr:hypothetical protein [Streptomyces rhizosphaericus]
MRQLLHLCPSRVLRIQDRRIRDLGVPALGERRGVVLGLPLARTWERRVTGAEAGHHFQQMRHPQLGELQPALFQVLGRLALAAPVGPRRRRP